MIYILTGPIRTGKTTALLNWIKNRTDIDGVLCPDDNFGKRYFLKVKSKKEFKLEVEIETEDIIKIGNFKFLKSAFEKANNYLLSLELEMKLNCFIIDELGKLELKNEGLHLSSEILIPKYMSDKKHHLILVVRDYLLDEIVKHYNISKYSVLKKEDLNNLSFRT